MPAAENQNFQYIHTINPYKKLKVLIRWSTLMPVLLPNKNYPNNNHNNSLYGKSWYSFSKLQKAEVVLVDTLYPDESSKRLYKYEARLDGAAYAVAVAKGKKAAMGAAARVALKRLGLATAKKKKEKKQKEKKQRSELVV